MKFQYFFLLAAMLFMVACNDDDAGPVTDGILHYDGANNSGPVLAAGEHELAVHFPSETMADYTGKVLTEIDFFVGTPLPETCKVRVYKGGDTAPDAQIYEFDVTSGLQTLSWNKHVLSTPVDLDGDDLWLGVFVVHASEQQSIGCDAGPRKEDGDWLYQSLDSDWKTYAERTGESVNWNIRGTVE